LWLTVEAAQHGSMRRWVLLYIVTSLCFYTHLLAALIVPVQVLWLLILSTGRTSVRRWIGPAIYLAALLLPYLPLLRWQSSMWLSPFETGHPFVPLGDIFAVLAVAFSRGVLPVRAPISLLPAILALVAGLGLWATAPSTQRTGSSSSTRKDRWRVVAVLGVWLFLPPLAVYGVSLGMPLFTDRYLIWCMPAFLALASLGIIAFARVWRPLGAAVLAGMLAAGLAGVWAQGTQPVKSDFRAAARFVLAHQRPGDLLVFQIPYNRFTFSYYSAENHTGQDGRVPEEPSLNGELPWVDGPFTNDGATQVAVAEQMVQRTAGSRGVWLIASEVPMWDQRGLTQRWLSDNGNATDRADFVRVSVTRYELKK
jgi:hypothetical protein